MKKIFKNIRLYFSEYMKEYKKKLLLILILLAISLCISILLPYIVSIMINTLEKEHSGRFFYLLASLYFSLVVIKMGSEILNAYISEKLGWTISNNLRGNLIEHCVSLSFSFHQKHKAGEMIERVDGDITFLSNFFSEFLVNIVGNTFFVAAIISIFYFQSGVIGIGYSIIVILAYCSILMLQDLIIKLWGRYREDEAQLYGYIQDSLLAREDIVGVGEENYLKMKLSSFLMKIKSDFRKAVVANNIPTSGFFGLLNIGDFVAIGVGIYLFYQSELSLGSVYLISNYVGLLNRPFIALRYEFDSLQRVGASLSRITELFSIKNETIRDKHVLKGANFDIEIKNLGFTYEDMQTPVLKNLSLKIKAGEKIGIVGRTGSGKSTLIKLIAKMYEPQKGEIFFSGVNLKQISSKELYEHLFVITQNVRIFNGTVYENVTCFDSTISRDDVTKALHKVGLTNWLEKLPLGIDTPIDKNLLSAGQEQLLYICRAFLRNAEIYILDEINSKLDVEAEAKVFTALDELMKNKTIIVIAHKLQILEHVDKILIMENGEISMYGEQSQVYNHIIERNIEV